MNSAYISTKENIAPFNKSNLSRDIKPLKNDKYLILKDFMGGESVADEVVFKIVEDTQKAYFTKNKCYKSNTDALKQAIMYAHQLVLEKLK